MFYTLICFFLVKEIPYKESMLFYVGKLIIYIIICIGLKKKNNNLFLFQQYFSFYTFKKENHPTRKLLMVDTPILTKCTFQICIGHPQCAPCDTPTLSLLISLSTHFDWKTFSKGRRPMQRWAHCSPSYSGPFPGRQLRFQEFPALSYDSIRKF